MVEPTTPLKALIIPNTGDLVGTWGSAAINPDMTAIDGMLGGVQSISVSSGTTITLSAPAGSITPGAGPNQAQNAILKFSGTLTGAIAINLPLPGYYIMVNNCVVGTNYIQIGASPGGGSFVGLPPGKASKIWTDGTNVGFCDTPEVGSYMDMAVSSYPSWMTACSTLPYLICDGSVYNISTYPFLGALLGATFGGNGATTFGVPDLRARYRIPLDGGTNRITFGGSGITGTSMGSAGGAQSAAIRQDQIPNYSINVTVTDTRTWGLNTGGQQVIIGGGGSSFGGGAVGGGVSPVVSVTSGSISASANSGGSGSLYINLPPGMVSGVTFIKT